GCGLYRRNEDGGERQPLYVRLGQVHITRISIIAEQLEEICRYAESVTKQKQRDSTPVTYQDITPEKVEKALGQIDDTLNGVEATCMPSDMALKPL
ncbi:hypothetical protein ACJEEO_12095, partial [Phocaeicola coprocola]